MSEIDLVRRVFLDAWSSKNNLERDNAKGKWVRGRFVPERRILGWYLGEPIWSDEK